MSTTNKWLRIRVTDLKTGKKKTNVRIPAGLANFGMKMAAKYAPESIEDLDMELIQAAIENGNGAMLLDVEDEEKGERVEISVE